jgi:hypothetical protein
MFETLIGCTVTALLMWAWHVWEMDRLERRRYFQAKASEEIREKP